MEGAAPLRLKRIIYGAGEDSTFKDAFGVATVDGATLVFIHATSDGQWFAYQDPGDPQRDGVPGDPRFAEQHQDGPGRLEADPGYHAPLVVQAHDGTSGSHVGSLAPRMSRPSTVPVLTCPPQLPAGFAGAPYRATDGTVYCVAEGHGRSIVGGSTFAWGPHDVFVVPSWCKVAHQATDDAVLFSFSDRPVQKALDLWREEAPVAASAN